MNNNNIGEKKVKKYLPLYLSFEISVKFKISLAILVQGFGYLWTSVLFIKGNC